MARKTTDGKKRKRKFPWQQNFRRVPDFILERLKRIEGDVRVGTARRIAESAIADDVFEHIGIVIKDGSVTHPEQVIPPEDVGRWSYTNVNGWSVPRRDLPMVEKTFTAETPNYGDWYRGSHTIHWTRKVYQRDQIPPKELAIKIALDAKEPGDDPAYVFRFEVDEVLGRDSQGFMNDLFYDLNLLQENVGDVNVYASDATRDDYLATLYVDWEILPPGTRDEQLAVIIQRTQPRSEEQRRIIAERYDALARLNPREIVVGRSGFRHYFGGLIDDDLVVFENAEYGNALYVMGEDWDRLSQMSRTDLLRLTQREDFTRIPHTGDWKRRLVAEVAERRKARAR